MKFLQRYKRALGSEGFIIVVVILVVSISWSWLFSSKVSELADSLFFGYICALLAFTVIVGLSSYLFIKTLLFFKNSYRRDKAVSPWVVPLLFLVWSGVEYLVATLSAAVWIGDNGSIDTVLPFASFTPVAAHTPLRYISRFIGYHGLSAVVVVLLYVCSIKKLRQYFVATLAVVVIATACAWALYRNPSGSQIQAVIVAERIDQAPLAIPASPDVVVLPEYGITNVHDLSNRFVKQPEGDLWYVGSEQLSSDKGNQNVLVFGSQSLGIIERRPKPRLIPGGEYLPYFAKALLTGLRANHTLRYFDQTKAVQKGPANYSPLQVSGTIRLGSAVCASIIATEDYRRFSSNGATVLTNSASLGIFASKLFTFQHQGLATFMATANARPFLQSSNGATAFAIDHNGTMIAEIAPLSTQEVGITSNTRKTPYTRFGEWPAYAGVGIILVWIVRNLKRLMTNKRSKPGKLT